MAKYFFQEDGKSPLYELEKYSAFLKQTNDTDKQVEIMREVYSYLKLIAPSMYTGLEMNSTYCKMIKKVLELEKIMNKGKLLNIEPNFDSSFIDGLCYEGEAEEKVKSIVQKIRELLFIRKGNKIKSFSAKDLTGYCFICAIMVEKLCKVRGLKCKSFHLKIGFTPANFHFFQFFRFKTHFFSLVSFKNELYLVDISYSQFFWLKNNLIEKLGVPLLSGCSVGIYMTMTEERKKVAETLLRDGYVKVTPQVLKDYLDGFALSYRNGLSYEGESKPSYTTDYSVNDYLRFLYGEDNQFNHESEYTLGIQKRPLSRF